MTTDREQTLEAAITRAISLLKQGEYDDGEHPVVGTVMNFLTDAIQEEENTPLETRPNETGGIDYKIGDYWLDERDVCHKCLADRLLAGKAPREAEPQTCMGIYAGKSCDDCHNKTYRTNAQFDPMDAGEAWGEDDY